jgi:hypothetical protein
MSRPLALVLALAVAAGGLLTDALLVTSAGAAPSPHITARPNSIMVNHTTTLTGRHWPASKKVTLEECTESTWVVMQSAPCDTNNVVTVKADAKGQFKTVFTVHTCPTTDSSPPGFEQTCFIGGNPAPSGVDTIALQGAVKITVTGP